VHRLRFLRSTGGCGPDDRASASGLPLLLRICVTMGRTNEPGTVLYSGCGRAALSALIDHHLTTYKKKTDGIKLPRNFQFAILPASSQACDKLDTRRRRARRLTTARASDPQSRTVAVAVLMMRTRRKNPHLPPPQLDETGRPDPPARPLSQPN
jgi:hypothetical protein